MKSRDGKSQRREEKKKEDHKRDSLRRKKIQVREQVGRSRNTVFFHWFVAPEGRKVGSLKRRVRSQLARWEMKNCTPLWREAHCQVKMYKAPQLRSTFWSWDVEKVRSVVARSTFPSQNVQNTPGSDHFWTFRCRFAWQAQGIVHLVQREQNVRVLWHFQLQPPLHHTRLQYTTTPSLHSTTLHYTPLRYTQLHTITLNYIQLRSITVNYIQLRSITLNYTQLHSITLDYTTLHSTTLQLHYATFHYTTLHSTTLHYTPLHSTTLNYTTLHYITLH